MSMHTPEHITVYRARRVITMEPGNPTATAVAVRGNRIIEAGSVESMQPWLRAHPHSFDDQFADKVILPGFIDPHLHPMLGAILLTCKIVAPESWDLPGEPVPACPDRAALLGRLHDLLVKDSSEPLFVWGHHPIWHGAITRTELDALSPSRPIVLWHRSFHEIVLNSAAMTWLGLVDQSMMRDFGDQFDWDAGHFYEGGILPVMQKLMPYLAAPERIQQGLQLTAELINRGGVTTCGDLCAGGMLGPDIEQHALSAAYENDRTPFRTYLVPSPLHWMKWHNENAADTLARIDALPRNTTGRLQWINAVKTFADGAFFSQLMHLCEPGYIDGHCGEWITPPDELLELSRPFWKAGYDFYIHANGDRGVDASLDVLTDLLTDHPRPDFRYDLQHFGISREDQVTRIARLGSSVSANGYYVHLLADKYAEHGIGSERAEQMTRLGSLARQGVPFSLHSDLPMGPVNPLLAVSAAVTRHTADGNVRGLHQKITIEQALRAVTIDAAWALRKDHEIGSIAAGKMADFAVLDCDPFDVDPAEIRDIPVRATVFEGVVFPIDA